MDRRRTALAAALLAAAGLLPVLLAPGPDRGAGVSAAPRCVAPSYPLTLPGQPEVCVHSDVPPPHVDVHEEPSTSELRARKGASAAAVAAAEELGVPSAYATTATAPAVACDGDGTTGPRVQAMYVVEASKANRYAALLPSFRLWAAGVDDVVNRTAALTGGVRGVRYVTDLAGDGSCLARVLNVTVPDGSMVSFGSTVQAVQALGYTSPVRKYLMWTDATSLCGVASMYLDDRPDQANVNNGAYAQYARVDAGCWGWGNGTNQHSVEAHELVHTLGGVQYSATHSTRAGHCWDEADTMCYSDGGGFAMVSVCPAEREYLLDCSSDDYFSTYPPAGSYLDTHWNAADSRFLLGGGDGSSGGALGTPTTLGGTLTVNNPAVPGLATQATATPELPSGRSLAGVSWRVARADCAVVPTGDGTQASVTCPATVTTATSVTAVLTDSTGATRSVTSPLTFQTGGVKRAVRATLAVQGQSGTASLCTGLSAPAVVTVLDQATGVPVKGLVATLTRQYATQLTPSVVALRVSGTDGTATSAVLASAAATFRAATAAAGPFSASAAAALSATTSRCTADLAGTVSATDPWYGDSVTVEGTLRRSVTSPGDTAVPGASLAVTVKAPDTLSATGTLVVGRTTTLGLLRTAADGSFRGTVRATTSGLLRVALPASASLAAASAELGTLAVRLPATTLTAVADRSDVGYGGTVTLTGSLVRQADGSTPLAGSVVAVRLTAPGRTALTLGSARVAADGSYVARVAVRAAGVLEAVYAGVPGQPSATAVAGPVTVGTWTTALTLASSAPSAPAGGYVTLTGSATRSYGGSTEPARYLPVRVVLSPASGAAPYLLTTVWTRLDGTFSLRYYPRAAAALTGQVQGVVGHAGTTTAPVAVTVR